jgi:hypothetical protein
LTKVPEENIRTKEEGRNRWPEKATSSGVHNVYSPENIIRIIKSRRWEDTCLISGMHTKL